MEDDGVGFGKAGTKGGMGTGLANCRERLQLHYGDRHKLQVSSKGESGTVVTLHIPRGEV